MAKLEIFDGDTLIDTVDVQGDGNEIEYNFRPKFEYEDTYYNVVYTDDFGCSGKTTVKMEKIPENSCTNVNFTVTNFFDDDGNTIECDEYIFLNADENVLSSLLSSTANPLIGWSDSEISNFCMCMTTYGPMGNSMISALDIIKLNINTNKIIYEDIQQLLSSRTITNNCLRFSDSCIVLYKISTDNFDYSHYNNRWLLMGLHANYNNDDIGKILNYCSFSLSPLLEFAKKGKYVNCLTAEMRLNFYYMPKKVNGGYNLLDNLSWMFIK